MRILVILPNWLGDAIMTTPAIELICKYYPQTRLTFLGSHVSIEALKHHPNCEASFIDTTKQARSRLLATYQLAKHLGSFDLALSFRNHLYSSILLRCTKTVISLVKDSWHSRLLLSHTPKIVSTQHLALQYAALAMINTDGYNAQDIGALRLYIQAKKHTRPTLGINAGATYGSAKRWYPERFAEVGAHFATEYDILIFGGPTEADMAKEIEDNLITLGVKNYTNLAAKTTVIKLCENIAGCSLFITNDSGPMHVAAAYQVPTVAIFGPTRHKETSQWMNAKSSIVRLEMECAPCMQRECPLKHHECMKNITASQVIKAVQSLEI